MCLKGKYTVVHCMGLANDTVLLSFENLAQHLPPWLVCKVLMVLEAVLLYHLAGCELVQSQACSKYNCQQAVRVHCEFGIVLSLQDFSDMAIISSLGVVDVGFLFCNKRQGKQERTSNVPVTEALAEFLCVIFGGSLQSFPSVTLHQLNSMGVIFPLCLAFLKRWLHLE